MMSPHYILFIAFFVEVQAHHRESIATMTMADLPHAPVAQSQVGSAFFKVGGLTGFGLVKW